jgi:MFS family permease
MGVIRQFRSFDRPIRVLVINSLINNIGFYMLIPFLAGYFANNLGLVAWTVGLVLGARNLSQQGLFIVGGSLSDRVGYKPVIVAGCVLRAIGFAMFGLVESLPGLVIASLLSGFAAALSTPAARAYLAHESGERRPEAFALLGVAFDAGSLIGPIVGAILLGTFSDFRLVCAAAAGLFLVLAFLQWRYLPHRAGVEAGSTRPILQDWREVLGNRAFVLFALGMLGYFALINQMYMGIPLEVRRLTGSDASVGLLFTFAAILSIAAQVEVTAFSVARWRPPLAIATGMALMGLSFVPVLLASPVLPVDMLGLANLAPVVLTVALLELGVMLAQPFAMDLIPTLGAGRLIGTYIGMYYLVQGVGGALGNLATGAAFDLARDTHLVSLPWVALTLVGLASATSIVLLDRRGLLSRPATAAAAQP